MHPHISRHGSVINFTRAGFTQKRISNDKKKLFIHPYYLIYDYFLSVKNKKKANFIHKVLIKRPQNCTSQSMYGKKCFEVSTLMIFTMSGYKLKIFDVI